MFGLGLVPDGNTSMQANASGPQGVSSVHLAEFAMVMVMVGPVLLVRISRLADVCVTPLLLTNVAVDHAVAAASHFAWSSENVPTKASRMFRPFALDTGWPEIIFHALST